MSKPGVVLPDTMAEVLYMDGDSPQEQCLEKKVYYKIISGTIGYHVQKNESHIPTSKGFMHQSLHISVTSI